MAKPKILHDKKKAEELQTKSVTLHEHHIPPMLMRFSSYSPLTVPLLTARGLQGY